LNKNFSQVSGPEIGHLLSLTARRFNYVAASVRVGMCFCKVPLDGRAFGVTMKLSRWGGPDKWAGFVTSRKSCQGGVQKP